MEAVMNCKINGEAKMVETVMNYEINGRIMSFKDKEEMKGWVNDLIDAGKSLEVAPFNQDVDYDHMQAIMDLSFEAEACIKGIIAIATVIQEQNSFINQNPDCIQGLGIRINDVISKIMEIAEETKMPYQELFYQNRDSICYKPR